MSSTTSSNTFSSNINDYELIAEIGVGSFGRVYEAICKTNDTKCAVKKIIKCNTNGSKRRPGHPMAPNINKIKTEVLKHSRLIHSNICQLYKVIEDESNVYLILELCSGGSLKDLIKLSNNQDDVHSGQSIKNKYEKPTNNILFRRTRSDSNLRRNSGSLVDNSSNLVNSGSSMSNSKSNKQLEPVISYNLIRIIMRQIIDGLSYLHRNHIIHRDLNINNILFKERLGSSSSKENISSRIFKKPEIKIVDFGLALDLNSINNYTKDHYINNVTNHVNNDDSMVGTTICGTPGFISPEVWKQTKPISTASDVFSLGSILYSLISGVTVPNGDINLDTFPPLAADLITKLLIEDPNERLSLNEIINHPFMIGPINTSRLSPIIKTTKSLKLSLTADGAVEITFFKSNVQLIVKNYSTSIVLIHLNSSETPNYPSFGMETPKVRRKKKFKPPEVYTLDTLPVQHWKKYVYASKFVNLIRDKTPKVIFYCNHQTRQATDANTGSINHKVSSIDYKGDHYVINKVVLMENNEIFEGNILNISTNIEFKIFLEENISEKYSNVLYQQLFDLYQECLSIESNIETLCLASSNDYFPITIGKRPKREVASPSSSSPLNRNSISTFSPSINMSSTMSSSSPLSISTTSPGSLRSVTIKNLGIATQLTDGIEVRFNDGSSLIYKSSDSNVIYSDSPNGPTKRYTNPKLIPPFVRDKLQLARKAITELKGKSPNTHSLS